ncbi:MAG TPA: DUF1343 domain-containing protein [Vicinamibacterales bacterium]|nr:DUF1343 domain-containing protein [Vicinamibacterales bacterium]
MVRLGSDLLLASSRLKGARVGIVCNHASLDRGFLHIVDRLAAAPDVTLAAIFGPQHGFRSDVQDNMIETPHADDPARRVPVYSLYSETREPTAAMLAGLDFLVIDLQDIGARIYTYIYTMANCLRASARHGVRVIVCDRPNPIGGTDVEGALLVEGFESFVGQFPIPMRHGMTIGELARLFNEHFAIGASLEIVQMEGWRREMYSDATDLPWVMPSPNIPTLDTAIVYPGTVLFEGILLSEGRGTTRPFELIGAPWIEAESFARQMNALKLPGAYFRPAVFEPTFQKHAKQTCGGCQIHVTDRQQFQPVLVGVALIAMFHQVDPARFAWRQPPYEYEHDKMPIDILAGSDKLRGQIEAGTSARDIAASWKKDEESFRKLREPFLLY